MAKEPRNRRPHAKLSRAEQLRLAKQRQRARAREAGIRKLELHLPADDAERVRIAVADPAFRGAAGALLDRFVVDLHAWPTLRELAWNRADRWIPAADALALYERNWRFVDPEKLDERERAFIRRLARDHGGGHLNV